MPSLVLLLAPFPSERRHYPLHASELVDKCRVLHTKPGVLEDFYERKTSDRFQEGTKTVVIRNATIWTGRVQGLEVLKGDLVLEGGILRKVGVDEDLMGYVGVENVEIGDAQGWVLSNKRVWV